MVASSLSMLVLAPARCYPVTSDFEFCARHRRYCFEYHVREKSVSGTTGTKKAEERPNLMSRILSDGSRIRNRVANCRLHTQAKLYSTILVRKYKKIADAQGSGKKCSTFTEAFSLLPIVPQKQSRISSVHRFFRNN